MGRLHILALSILMTGCAAFQPCNPPAAGTFCSACPEGSNGICCAGLCCEGDCTDGVCKPNDLTADTDTGGGTG